MTYYFPTICRLKHKRQFFFFFISLFLKDVQILQNKPSQSTVDLNIYNKEGWKICLLAEQETTHGIISIILIAVCLLLHQKNTNFTQNMCFKQSLRSFVGDVRAFLPLCGSPQIICLDKVWVELCCSVEYVSCQLCYLIISNVSFSQCTNQTYLQQVLEGKPHKVTRKLS